MKLGYLGIDQYGVSYRIDRYPRKELAESVGGTNITKMYVDKIDGTTKHIGYIINGLWIRVYEVHEWSK